MDENNFFSKLEESVYDACQIDNDLFDSFDVKRGLRNKDGTGVLVGLTNIGDVVGYKKENGEKKQVLLIQEVFFVVNVEHIKGV